MGNIDSIIRIKESVKNGLGLSSEDKLKLDKEFESITSSAVGSLLGFLFWAFIAVVTLATVIFPILCGVCAVACLYELITANGYKSRKIQALRRYRKLDKKILVVSAVSMPKI